MEIELQFFFQTKAASIFHEKESRRGPTEAETRWSEPVEYSDWAEPIIPVLKPNGQVCICGDYKVTVNKASKLEQDPVPTLEDLITKLGKGSIGLVTCILEGLSWSQRVGSLWQSTPTKVCSNTNTSPMVFPVHQLSSRGLWSPCCRAYLQLLCILMTFWWLEIQQLSHSRIWIKSSRAGQGKNKAEGEVYFWCWRSCVPWQRDQQVWDQTVWWEGRGSGSSKTTRKHPAVEGMLGAPGLLWPLSEKPVRRTASPIQTVAKESQVDLGSRATALFWEDRKDDPVSQSSFALWSKQAIHSAHQCFTQHGPGAVMLDVMEDGSEHPVGFVSRTMNVAENYF